MVARQRGEGWGRAAALRDAVTSGPRGTPGVVGAAGRPPEGQAGAGQGPAALGGFPRPRGPPPDPALGGGMEPEGPHPTLAHQAGTHCRPGLQPPGRPVNPVPALPRATRKAAARRLLACAGKRAPAQASRSVGIATHPTPPPPQNGTRGTGSCTEAPISNGLPVSRLRTPKGAP